MKTFIFDKNDINNNTFIIKDSEFNHLKNVMRLKKGDEIKGVCFDEFNYYAKICEINKNNACCEVIKKGINTSNPKIKVSVFQALIKKEHLNLCIQKLTELGVSEFYPYESEFCTVKKTESKHIKLQEVSNQSVKQCGRSIPMNVGETISFNEMLKLLAGFDLIVFANETEKIEKLSQINFENVKNVAIIIGCEGGFAPKEIYKLISIENLKSVSLGKRILRAETASICLSSIILNKLGEI